MADRRSIKGPQWEAETLRRISTFLQLLYKDLKGNAKVPKATEKLRNSGGLAYEYWEAVKKLKIVTVIGTGKGAVVQWDGQAPTPDMPEKVLTEVRREWANKKLEARDKRLAGISPAAKLKPIVLRKQHNAGTLFLNLQSIYNKHEDKPFDHKPFVTQYELPDGLFEGVVNLEFMEKINDAGGSNDFVFRWTKDPTLELAELLFEEYFKDRHRTRDESYTVILKVLHKLWATFKQAGKKPVDSSEVNKIFAFFELPPKLQVKTRAGVLRRVKTGERGVARYTWLEGLGVPDLGMAENVYHERDPKTGTPQQKLVEKHKLAHVVAAVHDAKDAQHNKNWVETKLDEVRGRKVLLSLELLSLEEQEKALELVLKLQ